MQNFDQAEIFYLRGFGSEYIKRRTGVSMQSLLKQLKARGIVYTKTDIIAYQVDYIKDHYSEIDVKRAYVHIMTTYSDLDKARRGRHIECLGCGFGDYPKVFQKILGLDVYRKMRDEFWKQKQQSTMLQLYGVDNYFKTEDFQKDIPMRRDAVKEKRRQTMLSRYGVEHPNQNSEIKARMEEHLCETLKTRYNVERSVMQNPEIAKKSAINRQKAMFEKYGAANSVQVKEIRDRIFEARRKNGTLNSSHCEEALYRILVYLFGADQVIRNRVIDDRYPFHVDFYIKCRDLFIEMNGDKCHGDHWFDPSSKRDQQILNAWRKNAAGNPKSRYAKYISTWTDSDVCKRKSAKENSLNYLVFWDSRRVQRKGKMIPRLLDVYAWIEDGCPDSKDWHSENTY